MILNFIIRISVYLYNKMMTLGDSSSSSNNNSDSDMEEEEEGERGQFTKFKYTNSNLESFRNMRDISEDNVENEELFIDPFIDVNEEKIDFNLPEVYQMLAQHTSSIKYNKKFLLYHVFLQLAFLKSNYYHQLKPGRYYIFCIITKNQFVHRINWYNWKRRFPYKWHTLIALTFDKRNEEFFLLIPSKSTRNDLDQLRLSRLLDFENFLYVLEKPFACPQMEEIPNPNWLFSTVTRHFGDVTQFDIHPKSLTGSCYDPNIGRKISLKKMDLKVYKVFEKLVEKWVPEEHRRNCLYFDFDFEDNAGGIIGEHYILRDSWNKYQFFEHMDPHF